MLTQQAKDLGIHPSQVKKVKTNDLADMKFNELRILASERGISVPFGTKKAELINLLLKGD